MRLVAVREPDLARLESRAQLAHPRAVTGVAVVVPTVAIQGAPVGCCVDLVDGLRDRREAARDEGLTQAFGREREVAHRAKAAEALPEDAPAIDAQLLADQLRVAHDRIGAEVREVVRLRLCVKAREASDRGRAPRSALVEQQHSKLGERALEPARGGRVGRRAGCLEAGATLEEHEERSLAAVGIGDLPGEHADVLTIRARMLERHRELVLGDDEPRNAQGLAARRAGTPILGWRCAVDRAGWVCGHRGNVSDTGPGDPSAHGPDSTIGPSGRSKARTLVNALSQTLLRPVITLR